MNGEDMISVERRGRCVIIAVKDRGAVKLSFDDAEALCYRLHEVLPERISELRRHGYIFINGNITEDMAQTVQSQLYETAFYLSKTRPVKKRRIMMYINSGGGNCTDGFCIMDTIRHIESNGVEVWGVVFGTAYSLACVLLQCCTKRLIGPNAMMMVHQLSYNTSGKIEETETTLQYARTLFKSVADIYASRNTAGNKTPEFWLEFMKGSDKYITPKEAIKLGLADCIYKGGPLIP